MKILIVGCGSIGKRHLRNLKALEAGELLAYDPRADRAQEAAEQAGAKPVATLEAGLEQRPDLAVITTPNSLHVPPALAAAKAGCSLFIEKPLSHSMDGVDELQREVERRGLIALVGCNMRFHPGVSLVGKLLREGAIGRVVTARVMAGSYLPEWHPWEDYRRGYSARADLGGGAILDGIHEIDYLLDLLGDPEEVACMAGRFSDIEVQTEDAAEIMIRFAGRALANIHLDYVQRAYRRNCLLSGTEGTLEWDFAKPEVRVYKAVDKAWAALALPEQDVNEMYLAEARHLLDCVAGKAKPLQGLPQARRALEVALAAKQASETGRTVSVTRSLA